MALIDFSRFDEPTLQEVQYTDTQPSYVEMIDGTQRLIMPGQIAVFMIPDCTCGMCQNEIVEIKEGVFH